MYDSVLLIALTAFVSSVLSFPYSGPLHFRNNVESTLISCSSLVKPCKIIVKVDRTGFIPEQTFTSPPICDCHTESCPVGWNDAPEKTITRYLRSKNKVMTMQLKFCQAVEPQRACNQGESALVIRGRTMVPQEIVDFRCRCPHNRPMVVKKAWFQDYEHYQEYVCDLPSCSASGEGCMTVSRGRHTERRQETTYNCECGEGQTCRWPVSKNSTGDCYTSNSF